MSKEWVFMIGFTAGLFTGILMIGFAARFAYFGVTQRACWFEVQAKGGDTLTVLKVRPDCRRILLPEAK